MRAPVFSAWSRAPDAAWFVEEFADLPGRLRRDPLRAALPPSTWWAELTRLPWPREFWMAEAGGRAVGRVGASLSPTHAGIGYVGFFEVDVEDPDAATVARVLLDAALAWLRERGVRKVYGPLDFATWFTYRFRVPAERAANEDAEPPFAWEPVNPPQFPRWFVERGFREAERSGSVGFRIEDPTVVDLVVATTGVAYDQALERGLRFRPFDAGHLEAELRVLYTLSMEAFAETFLFEPITFEVFRSLAVAGVARLAAPLIHFVLDPQGREAGFVFAFIDRDYAVVQTVALRPPFRGRRVSTALVHLVFKDAAARGLRRAIAALVRRDSPSAALAARYERIRAWRHDYALYEQRL